MLVSGVARLPEAAAWLLLATPRGFLAVLGGLAVVTLAALPCVNELALRVAACLLGLPCELGLENDEKSRLGPDKSSSSS